MTWVVAVVALIAAGALAYVIAVVWLLEAGDRLDAERDRGR